MNKPKKKIVEHWDYDECADWVAHKLGINDLRDCLGRWEKKWPKGDEPEYRDFWHFVLDYNESVHKGSYINIDGYMLLVDKAVDWQKEIVQTFIDEFGDNQRYWVKW